MLINIEFIVFFSTLWIDSRSVSACKKTEGYLIRGKWHSTTSKHRKLTNSGTTMISLGLYDVRILLLGATSLGRHGGSFTIELCDQLGGELLPRELIRTSRLDNLVEVDFGGGNLDLSVVDDVVDVGESVNATRVQVMLDEKASEIRKSRLLYMALWSILLSSLTELRCESRRIYTQREGSAKWKLRLPNPFGGDLGNTETRSSQTKRPIYLINGVKPRLLVEIFLGQLGGKFYFLYSHQPHYRINMTTTRANTRSGKELPLSSPHSGSKGNTTFIYVLSTWLRGHTEV